MKYSKKQKFFLFLISTLVGFATYYAVYAHKESGLTEWQKTQDVDFDKNTGATKFKAQLDSATIGCGAFCATAIFIVASARILSGKK